MARATYDDPAIEPLTAFDGARDAGVPAERLREVRARARALRGELLAGAPVRFFRSMELVRVPYPVRFGLLHACAVPTPYLHICNRLFVVQVDTREGLRTILLSPSDLDGNQETPFFKRLREGLPLGDRLADVVAPRKGTVEGHLASLGLRPEDVDYVAYDHLHTQDLRKWLGPRAFFPRAKLLVMRREWEITQGLLPTQRDWYCPDGTAGIDPSRVVLLDGDVRIGEGFAIVHTPGHTEGNMSFVTHAPAKPGGAGPERSALYVTSENGVAPESYAPEHSKIPGVARYARETGLEVILNGNTLESSNDQYISMIQEKELAGPSPIDPRFPSMACSSELGAFWGFPGVAPTFALGDLELGALARS